MTRKKPSKAKLDSKGRPIVVKAPDTDKQDGKGEVVAPLVRMGVLVLACSTHTGCEPDAVQVDPPAAVEPDPRLETAVTEAKAAAKLAAHHAVLAVEAAAACREATAK